MFKSNCITFTNQFCWNYYQFQINFNIIHLPCRGLIYRCSFPPNCTIHSFDAATRFGRKSQPFSGSYSI